MAKHKRKSAKLNINLSSILRELSENLDEQFVSLKEKFPVLSQATDYITELQQHLPTPFRKVKTGYKRKKSSDPLAQLSHKKTMRVFQDFSQKNIIDPLQKWGKHFSEQALERLNLPSRTEVIRLKHQIEQLDEKITLVQTKKGLSSQNPKLTAGQDPSPPAHL